MSQIISLVSSRPRVSKLEFFVALALVALAQSGKGVSCLVDELIIHGTAHSHHTSIDVSIEQVAKLAEQNTLPEPSLDLSQLHAAPSTFTFNRQASNPVLRSPAPTYSSDDPWSAPSRVVGGGGGTSSANDTIGQTNLTNGAPSNVAGSGLPREWWKKQEKVAVNFGGMQGFILNRYMVYDVVTDVRNFILRLIASVVLTV